MIAARTLGRPAVVDAGFVKSIDRARFKRFVREFDGIGELCAAMELARPVLGKGAPPGVAKFVADYKPALEKAKLELAKKDDGIGFAFAIPLVVSGVVALAAFLAPVGKRAFEAKKAEAVASWRSWRVAAISRLGDPSLDQETKRILAEAVASADDAAKKTGGLDFAKAARWGLYLALAAGAVYGGLALYRRFRGSRRG